MNIQNTIKMIGKSATHGAARIKRQQANIEALVAAGLPARPLDLFKNNLTVTEIAEVVCPTEIICQRKGTTVIENWCQVLDRAVSAVEVFGGAQDTTTWQHGYAVEFANGDHAVYLVGITEDTKNKIVLPVSAAAALGSAKTPAKAAAARANGAKGGRPKKKA